MANAAAPRIRPYADRRRPWLLAGVFAASAAIGVVAGLAVAHDYSTIALALALMPLGLLFLNYPFGAILVWIAVMPFFVQASDSAAANWILHRAMIPGLFMGMVVLHYLGIRRSAFRVHLYDLAIAAFLVLGIVNIATMSPNPERIGPAFFDKIVVPIVIFWYVRSIGVTPRDVGRLCVLGCVVILTQTGVGVMSWVAPSLLPDAWLVRAGERTAGTFGGPAPFTITLTLFALLAIHFAGQREVGWRRGALIAIAGVALLGVVFSLSRGSWLGTAGAGFGLLVLYPRIVAPIAVVSGLVIALLAVGPLQEQATYAAVRLETESTIDDRLVTNDASLRMIEDRPLSGFGFQNFERFDEAYKQRVGDIPLKIGGSSHNTYLNMAVEMGLPGVALYFSPVLALLVATVASRRSLRATGVISWPLAAVLWMALFDQFLVSNFLEMVHAYSWGTSLWWLTLGLIAAILEREHERAEDGREADAAPDSTGWRS